MNNKKFYLTKQGIQELEEELKYLKNEKRTQIIQELQEAREQGDLSENADYDAAREEQAKLEAKIKEIEQMLENVVLIKNKNGSKEVGIGSVVTIKRLDNNEEATYTIVGSQEADPFEKKISNESPIAKAIMSLKTGDIATVESPLGEYQVEILCIN